MRADSLKNISAIIFDMDGVIFDSETLYVEALFEVTSRLDLTISYDFCLQLLGLSWPNTRQKLIEMYGDDTATTIIRDWRSQYDLWSETRLSLKAGVAELLDTLDQLQIPRAIATGSLRANVEQHLAVSQLSHRFDRIVAHGDYLYGKPAPDPFLEAANQLSVLPSQCIAIEDSKNGVQSAAAAGMMVIMVPDLIAADQETAQLCAHVVDDLFGVRELLLYSRQ